VSINAASEVDVWCVELDFAPHGLESLLSRDELERADRFRSDRDRRRFVVAHGTLRAILGSRMSVDPGAIEFSAAADGKPKLRTGGLQFNLAHSGELAVVAVTEDRAVGIDVEVMRTVRDRDRLAARLFTEQESSVYSAKTEPQRDRAFLEIWTRKEAVLKAIGVGIGEHLGAISVPSGETRVEFRGQWAIRDLPRADEYVGAVAAQGSDLALRCHRYEPS
jgi:4'-phosphopantetheinyl transferase